MRSVLGGLLLAPAFLPLLYLPDFFYPYMATKTIAFRSLGILVLAVVTHLVLSGAALHFGRLKHKATWIPAALLAVMYVTSLFGIGFQHSFWSTFERGDGLLTATAAVVIFYGTLLHVDVRFPRRLAMVSMLVGIAVALIACVQWLQLHDRVGSTLGNAAYMSSYLAMTFFLTLWMAARYQGRMRIMAWAGAAVQLFAIVMLSSTRGTILALGVSGVVAAVYAAWKADGRTRLLARASLICMVALFALFLAFRTQLAQSPIVTLQRLATMSPTSDTGAVRLVFWRRLGGEALHRPLTGFGAEHVDAVYNKVYRPLRAAEWVDRSHNAILDYFVQYGIPGALLYVALLVAALRSAASAFRAGNPGAGYFLLLFVTCTVQNMFIFDIALTLWLFLAVLAATVPRGESEPQPLSIPSMPLALRWVPALLITVLLLPVSVVPARANMLLAKATALSASDPIRAAGLLQQGLSLGTHFDLDYGYQVYQMYAADQGQAAKLTGELRLRAYRTAVDVLDMNFNRYPGDARTAGYLAHVLDIAPMEATRDAALLDKAIDRSIRLSPGHVEPWYFRANIAIRKGDAAADSVERNAHYEDAIDVLSQYVAGWPERSDPSYVIAWLYLAMGDSAQAQAWAQTGEQAFAKIPDSYAARKAFRYYIKTSEWVKASRFLEFLLKADPKEHDTALILAKTSYLAGDKTRARSIIGRLRVDAPAVLATDPEFVTRIDTEKD